MMDIRLIASDVDGTMLPRGGAISDGLRRAIAACRARNIPFIISSGRWIGALNRVIRDCAAEGLPLIIANGAAVLGADGAPMREWPLDDADAHRAYDILRQYDIQINSYVRDALYCLNTRALKRQSTMIRDYIGADSVRLVMDDLDAFEAHGLRRCYKLEGLVEDVDRIARVREALSDTGLAVTHSSWRNVEVMAPGTGKGAALTWLAGELGVPLEKCMVFGDSANDLDMMSVAGWPVAVGNADAEVRAVARLVAPADVDDGVARVILEQVLEA